MDASSILGYLRNQIMKALGQEGTRGECKEGMDMALCILDPEQKQLEFAGANNPLYLIRNKELIIIKGDTMPVAIHDLMEPFSNHLVSLEEGDVVYIFSDGYADQFGGPYGKKFLSKRLKELLVSISDKIMSEQARILEETMKEWQGDLEQVDDMVLIGIRF